MALSRAEESVYVVTFFGQFKGKGNGGTEAPKLRNHVGRKCSNKGCTVREKEK